MPTRGSASSLRVTSDLRPLDTPSQLHDRKAPPAMTSPTATYTTPSDLSEPGVDDLADALYSGTPTPASTTDDTPPGNLVDPDLAAGQLPTMPARIATPEPEAPAPVEALDEHSDEEENPSAIARALYGQAPQPGDARYDDATDTAGLAAILYRW
jgi:hypothetical protein